VEMLFVVPILWIILTPQRRAASSFLNFDLTIADDDANAQTV